jgi:hypothetical protein
VVLQDFYFNNRRHLSFIFVTNIHYLSIMSSFLLVLILILGGPLYLYNDQNLCLHLGVTVDGTKDQCINPEGFANFLGLLESIPLHDTGSNYGSFEYAMPDLRYIALL